MVIRGGITMGYFDDAKASREEENTLEHSSGAWKKHKYIQKIGEGANAVYKYAKKSAKETWDRDITGKTYRDQYNRSDKKRDELAEQKFGPLTSDAEYDSWKRQKKIAEIARDKSEENYYNKSLLGKIDKVTKYDRIDQDNLKNTIKKEKSTVERGKSLIKDFFTPKTKVTASSNLTGKETIKPKPAEKVTLKKNKLSFKKN